MHKLISAVLPGILLALLLTSCFDSKEIDEQAYVLSMGIDKGILNKWRLTIQIPTEKGDSGSMGGGGQGDSGKNQGGQDGYIAVSIDAPSFFEGVNMLESSIPRHLNFEQLKYIIISEEMARSGKLGEFMVAPIRRYGQIRDSSHVIISRGSAKEFVNEMKPFIGNRMSKSQELYFTAPLETSFYPHVTLETLYDGIKSTYRQPIATLGGVNKFGGFKEEGTKFGTGFKPGGMYMAGELPRKGGSSIELFGTAVFDGDIMVGELNGEETRFMLIGQGEFKRGFMNVPDPKRPEYVVPMDVRQKENQRKVSVKIKNGKPVIHLKVELEGEILAIQSRINYEDPKLKPVLEKAYEQYIKKGLDELIVKTKSLKADIMQFGRIAVWQFGTIQEWESYNWIAQYEKAEVTTEVEFTIKRTGTMLHNSPVITTKGKE